MATKIYFLAFYEKNYRKNRVEWCFMIKVSDHNALTELTKKNNFFFF